MGGALNEPVIVRRMMKESGARKKWKDWREILALSELLSDRRKSGEPEFGNSHL
jgi:hypothetical protein